MKSMVRDYLSSIKKIRESFMEQKLDGILVSSAANIIHLTGYSNFSIHEREAYLVITQDKQFILTDGRYQEAVKREIPNFELLEISSGNSISRILEDLAKKFKIHSLGFEENNLTVKEYQLISKSIEKLKPIEVFQHRQVKDEYELEQIEKACKLGDKTFEYISEKIRAGISEKELAYEIETYIKKHGGDISFEPIVAFGGNSSVPHHKTGEKVLNSQALQDDNGEKGDNNDKSGQFVLLDFGVKINNYCSDMTRTVFFGKPGEKQRKIYETVKEAQQKAIKYINENIGEQIKVAEVDRKARDYIIIKGYPAIPHSLGHGIGVEVHEHPYLSIRSKGILKLGMVFSIEPGIYIEGFGGVRIEDLFVLEENGLRQLTKSPLM